MLNYDKIKFRFGVKPCIFDWICGLRHWFPIKNYTSSRFTATLLILLNQFINSLRIITFYYRCIMHYIYRITQIFQSKKILAIQIIQCERVKHKVRTNNKQQRKRNRFKTWNSFRCSHSNLFPEIFYCLEIFISEFKNYENDIGYLIKNLFFIDEMTKENQAWWYWDFTVLNRFLSVSRNISLCLKFK